MTRSPRPFTIAAAAVLALVLSAPARAAVRTIRPGQSIQAAIDAAQPGDRIVVAAGIYRENLTIEAKDHITLRGAGPSRRGTVLEPPANPHPSICTEFGEINGICITGQVDPITRANGTPITGTRLTGFLVRGFSHFGILVNNAIDTTIARDHAAHSRRWGIAAFIVTHIRYLRDSSHDNGQGGLYIADSPQADAVVIANRSFGNDVEEGVGLLVRDASHGVVAGNVLRDNCAGAWFLDAQLPGLTTDWLATGNRVADNTAACPPSEDIPVPLSGFGIALAGTHRVIAAANHLTGNQPSGDSIFGGGIVVASTTAFGGPDPTDNLVAANLARDNQPADLSYDGTGTGNRFIANRCASSIPDGLCG
jgi:hypothetical protein